MHVNKIENTKQLIQIINLSIKNISRSIARPMKVKVKLSNANGGDLCQTNNATGGHKCHWWRPMPNEQCHWWRPTPKVALDDHCNSPAEHVHLNRAHMITDSVDLYLN